MKPNSLCRYLRTKKMYIPAEQAAANETDYGHSAHCWCNRTMTETGPDDQWVGMDACQRTRSCFEE